MIPSVQDGAGRICWLASAIAGSWQWESPKRREEIAHTLAASYLVFERKREEMPPDDMAVAEVMTDLMYIIARSLSTRANKRLCKRIGIPYNPQYSSEPPF